MTMLRGFLRHPLLWGFLVLVPEGVGAQESPTPRLGAVPAMSANTIVNANPMVSPAPAASPTAAMNSAYTESDLSTLSDIPIDATAVQDAALRLVPVLADGSVRVEFENLLSAGALQRSLEGGLPVRIMLVVELWRDRFFDAQEGRFVWRATVHHDPLTESFRVEAEEGLLRYVDSLGEASDLLESWVSVPLRPPVSGRFYYLGRVEIETLSLSDLEELQRWLQGDLAPAMDEGEPVGGAVGRGVRRIFVRVLGLPTQRHEARSAAFDWSR